HKKSRSHHEGLENVLRLNKLFSQNSIPRKDQKHIHKVQQSVTRFIYVPTTVSEDLFHNRSTSLSTTGTKAVKRCSYLCFLLDIPSENLAFLTSYPYPVDEHLQPQRLPF